VNDSGPAPPKPRYAGLLRRLGAFAIDALVTYLVLSIAIYVIAPGWAGDDATSHQTAEVGLIVLAVITVWFNYLVVAEWRWGQTIGKNVTGTEHPRILRAMEHSLTWEQTRQVLDELGTCVRGPVLILCRAQAAPRRPACGHRHFVKDAAASAAGALPASAAGSLPLLAARAAATARARAFPRESRRPGDWGGSPAASERFWWRPWSRWAWSRCSTPT
jgi:hypothetical protein